MATDEIAARAEEIAATLTAAGAAATTDPAQVQPPCVLVTPPSVVFDGSCFVSLTWQLIAMGRPPANNSAATTLYGLLAIVHETLNAETAEPIGYTLPGAGTVPAYMVTLTPEGLDL